MSCWQTNQPLVRSCPSCTSWFLEWINEASLLAQQIVSPHDPMILGINQLPKSQALLLSEPRRWLMVSSGHSSIKPSNIDEIWAVDESEASFSNHLILTTRRRSMSARPSGSSWHARSMTLLFLAVWSRMWNTFPPAVTQTYLLVHVILCYDKHV